MRFFSYFCNRIEKHRHLRWLRRLTTTHQMKNQTGQGVSYFLIRCTRCGDRHHCDCRHYDLHHRCDRHLSLSFVDCSVLSGS